MAQVATQMTLAEYLAIDDATTKYEWVNDEAYAMAGGSPAHGVVTINIAAALHAGLSNGPCATSSPDQRVHVRATGAYFFPDVTVICPPWQTVEGDAMSVTNPILIVEVLSPSTEDYDRGGKLKHYRQIPSLLDVVLIDIKTRSATHYYRTEEGWSLRDITTGSIPLAALQTELPLSKVFAKLDSVPGA